MTVLDGRDDKFVQEAECIALNAAYFRSLGKQLIYAVKVHPRLKNMPAICFDFASSAKEDR